MDNQFELILCIVYNGYSDMVLSAAREAGARGGTIINARGTAKEEAERRYNIVITPEKEIVLIIASKDIKDDILHALYRNVGLNTPGQGIAFSVPVDDVIGIGNNNPIKE